MIRTSGLRKSFRTRKGAVDAVRGVDLTVQEGEIFGFLGPNGAGKTTTLRMLATLIVPDGGEATIAGADLRRARVPQGGGALVCESTSVLRHAAVAPVAQLIVRPSEVSRVMPRTAPQERARITNRPGRHAAMRSSFSAVRAVMGAPSP